MPEDSGLDVLVAQATIRSVQLLIGHIANARRELHPEQIEQGKNQLGVAGGVGCVLLDWQLGLVVEISSSTCVASRTVLGMTLVPYGESWSEVQV